MTLAALVLAAAAAAPTLSVDVSGKHIRVESSGASLSAILEELAARLDVRLVFDGQVPTTPVTATLTGQDLPALLSQLLEPRRIRYAASTDRGTRRVRALVVVTSAEARPTPPPTPTPVPEPEPQPFANSVPEPVLPDKASPPDEP